MKHDRGVKVKNKNIENADMQLDPKYPDEFGIPIPINRSSARREILATLQKPGDKMLVPSKKNGGSSIFYQVAKERGFKVVQRKLPNGEKWVWRIS